MSCRSTSEIRGWRNGPGPPDRRRHPGDSSRQPHGSEPHDRSVRSTASRQPPAPCISHNSSVCSGYASASVWQQCTVLVYRLHHPRQTVVALYTYPGVPPSSSPADCRGCTHVLVGACRCRDLRHQHQHGCRNCTGTRTAWGCGPRTPPCSRHPATARA